MKLLFNSVLSILITFLFYTTLFPQDFQKCGTFLPENLSKMGESCTRPSFNPASSEVQIIQTTNFNIHFITDDLPPLNPNDPPSDKTTWAYAEKVAAAAQEAWNFQINSLGWQAPPGDGTCGGGFNKYDIYIKRVNFYGATQPESQVTGTNRYTSYIIVTTGLIIGGVHTPLTENEIRVTLAHEFNHAIQFGYNGTKSIESNSWFFENTATWIEEIQYPEINDWITIFLNNPNAFSPLNRPYLPIDHFGNDYQYNGALFCHMLSRWFGNQFIQNIWQYAANSNNLFLSDINSVLISRNTNLKNALKKYAVWRYYTGSRDDGNHFPKGHLYNSSKILREYITGIGSGSSFPDDLWNRGGTSYITFKNADGVLDINFNGQDTREFSVIALNRRAYFGDTENTLILNSQNDGSIQNLSCIGDDEVVLIPIVTDWQSQLNINSYSYSSNYGQGISTSFWTEKESNNLNGTLTLQRSASTNSGVSKNLANQLDYNVVVNQERFLNVGGKTVKHNRWNQLRDKNFLNQQFRAGNDNNRQSAKYENMEYSRIQSRLEGQLIQDKGTFEFNDPWYVKSDGTQPGNYWITASGVYEPNGKEGATEKGVFLNQDFRIPNQPYYSVKADYLQTFNLSQTGRTHNFYFQGWSASPQGSAEFQYPQNLQTPVVFKQANATVQANYKGTQLSNNSVAYSKGSQRKFIRITNGNLISVYESMGNIYLERSTNNGASWDLFRNDSLKINNFPAHSPSIDFFNFSGLNDIILVTFVEDLDQIYANLVFCAFQDYGSTIIKIIQNNVMLMAFDRQLYGYGNPVIAAAGDGKFIIAFKGYNINSGLPGIVYRRGQLSNIPGEDEPHRWVLTWIENDLNNLPKLLYTDNLSLNPTIAEDGNTSGVSYQVAWEQSNAIRYCKLIEDANGNITQSSHSVISTGSSFMFHSSPSIIAISTGARVCWLGYNDEDPPNATVVFKNPANSRFWSFGSNASRPNINKSNDNTYFAFAWSQNNSTIKFADNGLSGVYEMIGITGKDVQLSNGNGKTNMYANIFKATSQPYFFTMSNNLNHYYSLQKSNGLLVSNGRTGVLRKNNAEIYFALGDISVDQQKVGFTECSPETEITDVNILNQYLESQPFEVTDNSGFEYTVQYGVVDTSVINGMFTQGEQVRFKVELVDNNTGELLGVYDDVIYDRNNHTDFENILYWVNTQGIGQRTVKLRLKVESNPGVEVSMVDRIDTESALGKSKRREMQYQGETLPKEFVLEQNYPNPFNPTTVISWQSPVAGHQTLKIYDILGNEVATLIDEYKEAGRYKLEYDASNLASGVYIYKLTAGSFVSSKKMMVIK